jgi:Tol biopolymer transport system component
VRELDPAWSPEGNYLLFSDNRNGNSDIWVLDPSTNRKRVLAAHLASDREPAWSPGGDRIAFSSNRNGTYDIWILE